MWTRLITSSVQCLKGLQSPLRVKEPLPVVQLLQVMRVSSWKPKEEISTKEQAPPKAEFLLGYDEINELVNAERDVQLIFDKSHSSKKELLKIERAALVDKYSRTEGDTGSLEIQVATLSHRIKNITDHLKNNKKDNSCKHGLIHLIHRRRKFLFLLKMRRPNAFHDILQDLKLKEPIPLPKIELKKKKKK